MPHRRQTADQYNRNFKMLIQTHQVTSINAIICLCETFCAVCVYGVYELCTCIYP